MHGASLVANFLDRYWSGINFGKSLKKLTILSDELLVSDKVCPIDDEGRFAEDRRHSFGVIISSQP